MIGIGSDKQTDIDNRQLLDLGQINVSGLLQNSMCVAHLGLYLKNIKIGLLLQNLTQHMKNEQL